MPELTADERRTYARHIILPEVGAEGQKKLLAARVLCIGAGGLGSPVLMYLAAAGVGHITLVEFDLVDESNLQRQIIHSHPDIGLPKGESARNTILSLNPRCHVEWINDSIHKNNILALVQNHDLVIDGTDNFPTRFLVNDACVFSGKPNIYGSIFRFEGQASVFAPTSGGPCYRCLFPEPPPPHSVPSCAEGGVLGVLPGIIGCIQATEAIKYLLGIGDLLINRLLVVDALTMQFRTLKIQRDPSCRICGDHPTQTGLIEYTGYCSLPHLPPPPSPECQVPPDWVISVHQLHNALKSPDQNTTILDVRDPEEFEIAHIPGARLIPLASLTQHLPQLPANHTYLVHCKSGKRSAEAVQILRSAGFHSSFTVQGGILAWAKEFDSSMPAY